MINIAKDPSLPQPMLYGPKSTDHTLISWGSNKGVILEALKNLKSTNFIHLPFIWPFPQSQLDKLTQNAKILITIECNSQGQLNRLIREQIGLKINHRLLKYDGRPFYPEEIIAYVQKNH